LGDRDDRRRDRQGRRGCAADVQLRQSVRIAATLATEPAAILRIVNEALMLEGGEALATAFVGAVSPIGRACGTRPRASAGISALEHGGMAVLDAAVTSAGDRT